MNERKVRTLVLWLLPIAVAIAFVNITCSTATSETTSVLLKAASQIMSIHERTGIWIKSEKEIPDQTGFEAVTIRWLKTDDEAAKISYRMTFKGTQRTFILPTLSVIEKEERDKVRRKK